MPDCPHCKAPIADTPDIAGGLLTCPRCGQSPSRFGDKMNPYESPASELATDLAPVAVPADFWGKLVAAVGLYLGQFPLIAGLLLLCELPVVLLGELVLGEAESQEQVLFRGYLLGAIQGLIVLVANGGILAALADRVEGRRLGFLAALRFGAASWGRLFVARLLAGFLVLGGFLLFIVPGVMLTVRYFLVDPIVVLERVGVSESLGRSGRLVRGRGWELFGGLMLVGFALIVFQISVNLAMELALVPAAPYPLLALAIRLPFDAAVIVAGGFITVWKFVYYWGLRSGPISAPAATLASGDLPEEEPNDEPNFGL